MWISFLKGGIPGLSGREFSRELSYGVGREPGAAKKGFSGRAVVLNPRLEKFSRSLFPQPGVRDLARPH